MKTLIKLSQAMNAEYILHHDTNCKTMSPAHEQYLYSNVCGIQSMANFSNWIMFPTFRPNASSTEVFLMVPYFQNTIATSHI